jgi:hypothetical protein
MDIEKEKRKAVLKAMIKLVADAAEKTPAPTVLDFFEKECMNMPLDQVIKALRSFAQDGKFPTLTALKQKMGWMNGEAEAARVPKGDSSIPYRDFPIGVSGIMMAEMAPNSALSMADSFFDGKKDLLRRRGYEVHGVTRYAGEVVERTQENGKPAETKYFQIKEHIQVTRIAEGEPREQVQA